jgi:hypothetical protein
MRVMTGVNAGGYNCSCRGTPTAKYVKLKTYQFGVDSCSCSTLGDPMSEQRGMAATCVGNPHIAEGEYVFSFYDINKPPCKFGKLKRK